MKKTEGFWKITKKDKFPKYFAFGIAFLVLAFNFFKYLKSGITIHFFLFVLVGGLLLSSIWWFIMFYLVKSLLLKTNRIPKIFAWIFTIINFLAQLDGLDLNENVLYQLFSMVIVLYVWWLIVFTACKWIGKFFTKGKRK